MTIELIRRQGLDSTQAEQAQRAVKVFRSLQPTLTAYARTLTGRRDVIVQMAAQDNGSTDGKNIYFRPPIGLGDNTPHDRPQCNKRKGNGLMACSACAIREEILVTIYHEIAHIAFDTFVDIPDDDKKRAVEFALKEGKGKWAEQVRDRLMNTPTNQLRWYGDLAKHVNEFLPFLVNCLEDARVNAAMFERRRGLKQMFYADTVQIFERGVEVAGQPERQAWREAPLNSQVMIGVFCLASGYEIGDWFHSDVQKALRDEELNKLTSSMTSITNARQVFALSIQVLARLRDLGYCGTPQDPDPEPEESSEPDDQEDSAPSEDRQPEDTGGEPQGEPDEGDSEGEGQESGSSEDSGSAEDSADSEDTEDGEFGPSESGTGTPPADTEKEEVDEQADAPDQGSLGDEDSPQDAPSEGDAAGDTVPSEHAPVPESGPIRGGDEGSLEGEDREPGEADHSGEGGASESGEGSGDEVAGDASEASDSGEPGESSGGAAASEADTGDGDIDSPDATKGSSVGGAGLDDEADQETGADSPASESEGTGEAGSETGEPSDGAGQSGGEPLADGTSGTASSDSGQASGDERGSRDSDTESKETTPVDDSEAIDTGADDGYGGTQVDDEYTPGMGTPDDIEPHVLEWQNHAEKPKTMEIKEAEEAMDVAIIQGIYFTKPSQNVYGVVEHHFDTAGPGATAWRRRGMKKDGSSADVEVPESILQPAIIRTRRAFSDNQRGAHQQNLRRGSVNPRVLGQRAWDNDDRLFSKRTLPGRRDYEVIIGMDVSYSTVGRNLALEKRAIMAQADMLDRVGIPFSIYAHTGDTAGVGMMALQVYHIKDVKEPWNAKTKHRLEVIGPASANLDGHALEFLRKRADQSRATDKIILYYSDGKMPQENHDEELAILTSEIRTCRNKKYTLLGVGIRTDSPRRHGLDTIQVDGDEDLIGVIKHLEKRISGIDKGR